MVVLQEAAQSLLAAHFAIAATHPLFSPWKKQNIFFSLMVSLSMVVLDVRCYIAFRASPIQGQSVASTLGEKVLLPCWYSFMVAPSSKYKL